MDADTTKNAEVHVEDGMDSLEGMSSNEDVTHGLENAGKILTRIELDLACSSEKLINLSILVMHVATRESDFEAFSSDKESDCFEKAMEFDLLSGILDSEVRELEFFMLDLRSEMVNAREIVSFGKLLGDAVRQIEEKLFDSEESLKQSQEQIADIKVQSADFQRILSSSVEEQNGEDNKGGVDVSESGDYSNLSAKIKMQTAEEKRQILRMLEKSLARELDLDKKLTDSRQNEEDLKQRLQQQVFIMEEQASSTWERLFQADNTAEILMGISKGLLGQLQILKFNLNGSNQREGELRSRLQSSIDELNEKNSKAENKVNSLEEECRLLSETNVKLNERLNLLERQLRESDIRLQHAVASAEASQERQTMLYSTIGDMENLIEGLKAKVSKAESLTESAEEKCIILSESNSDLNEELGFLRRRVECLEESLQQAEERKKETAKDISIRSKLITDLVVQLAFERERLHKQISSLAEENKVLVKQFQLRSKDSSVTMDYDDKGLGKEFSLKKHEFTQSICTTESTKAVAELSATSFEVDKSSREVLMGEKEDDLAGSTSKLNTVRDIDVRQLNFKFISMAVLMFAISALAAFLFSQEP